jgi:formylglycine-generating enzyme required for sulfatase activity
VVGVRWSTAQAYCRAKGGSLPTDEQWEWAARGQGLLPHPWGSDGIDLGRTHAYRGNGTALSPVMQSDQDRTPGDAEHVIYDLGGNAREWTVSLFRLDLPDQDESWVQANGASFRAVRGLPPTGNAPSTLPTHSTAWRDALCASDNCLADALELARYVGFRCVRSR